MKKLPGIIMLCIFICCTSCNREQKLLNKKLESWDKSLNLNNNGFGFTKPEAILESLKSIDTAQLSEGNAAYHTLLLKIAKCKSFIYDRNDTAIYSSINWYRKKKDSLNLCRSLLYSAIPGFSQIPIPASFKIVSGVKVFDQDSIQSRAYSNIQETEKIFTECKITNPDIESQIYTYLGRAAITHYEYAKGISYIAKSSGINKKLGNKDDAAIAFIDLSNLYLLQDKDNIARKMLDNAASFDITSPNVLYYFYKASDNYYYRKRQYEDAIENVRKMIRLKESKGLINVHIFELYGSLARYFEKMQMRDSLLHYRILALSAVKEESYNKEPESLYLSACPAYASLAESYAKSGDYQTAYNNYRSAYFASLTFFSKKIKNNSYEIEKKYDIFRKDAQIAKIAKGKMAFILSTIILAILLSGAILYSQGRSLYHKLKNKNLEEKISSLEAELNRVKSINLVHEASAGALPKLVEEAYNHASKTRRYSKELSDDLKNAIDNIKTLSKNNVSNIANNEEFLSVCPNVRYITNLSDLETVILVLVELNFNNKDIAELLNNSQASIRAIKTKIKEKILSSKGLPFNPEIAFSIFEKSATH